jgi:5-methylcytosine-specific restriction endonuclease McrBC GTP-binding regulatory subunit McrB
MEEPTNLQIDKPEISFDGFSKWYEENKSKLLEEANEWKRQNEKLTSEFLKEWPLESLRKISIDEYVIGKGSKNRSLCHEIENGKYAKMYLGIGGGNAGKFGIYWSKKAQTYYNQNNQAIPADELDEKFKLLKKDLLLILEKGINANFSDDVFNSSIRANSFFNRPALVTKLLCAYSKGKIFSGINMNKDQKKLWGRLIKLNKNGWVYKQNFDITAAIANKYPELDGRLLSSILWQYRNAVLPNEDTNKNKLSADKKEKENMITYKNEYSTVVLNEKNVVFHGAPGTGKTYLANQIAADIVSDGRTTNVAKLTSEQKQRIGFVQFHPSYDYTDFVEGLRPATSDDGVVNFYLKSGSFMSFVEKAKAAKLVNGQDNFEEAWQKFFSEVTDQGIDGTGYNELKTLTGKPIKDLVSYDRNGMQGVYPDKTTMYWNHDQIYRVYCGLPGVPKGGLDSYRKAIVAHLKAKYGLKAYKPSVVSESNEKKYVFIIDEINRGEISKIFGELFFSIDPEYRDNEEGVFTQYANLHKNTEEKFYVPGNVYIIGTMNDIDRSVDTFDFAMRRRFTFIEITAEESAENMNLNPEVKEQMQRLNKAIIKEGGLTTDYQIGASYFKNLVSPEVTKANAPLWNNKLYPLLKDYFRGEREAKSKLAKISKSYFSKDEED